MTESNKLSANEILEKILKFEETYPVTTWRLFNFHIWPVIRISLGLKMMLENFLSSNNQISSSDSSHISEALGVIKNSITSSFSDSDKNQKTNKSYDAVFLNASSTRYYKVNEKWFNPFSDPFINHLQKNGIESLVLEYPDTSDIKIPRYNPSNYIGTGITMMGLNALIEKKIERTDLSLLNNFNDFLSEVNLSADFFLIKLLRVYNYSVYFERILKKAKPSIIIVEGFYSYIAMGMVLAANKLGIPCIDVQHGVQSENDFLFSDWNNLPPNGYEVLPDVFWCWSDEEKKNIERWSVNGKYFALTGGNPVLELPEVNETEIFREVFSSEEEIKILYTHQADFNFSDLFVNILKSSPDDWKWFIRFHPQYPEAKTKVLQKLSTNNFKNVVVDNISEFPLPSILNKIDLHVTEFSSTVLEAEALGVPSIVLSEYGKSLFNKQIEKGNTKFVSSKEMFENELSVLIESNKDKDKKNNNHEYFTAGIEMIKKIVNDNKRK